MKKIYNDFDTINCIEHFSKKETILSLFHAIDLNNYAFGRIERSYTFDDDRCGLIVQMTDENTKRLSRIIIDIRNGQPSSQQVLDVVYELGADCDKRIVICGNSINRKDVYDQYVWDELVEGLIEMLNTYNSELYLVQAKTLINGHQDGPNFITSERFKEPFQYGRSELPSKRKIEEVIFWIVHFDKYVFDAESWIPSVIEQPGCWLVYYDVLNDYCLHYSQTWTDEGLFLKILPGKKPEMLEWLLGYNKVNIQDYIKEFQIKLNNEKGVSVCDSQINLDMKSGKPQELSVRIIELPFSTFMHFSPKEKDFYAGQIFHLRKDFAYFIEELIDRKESVGD